VAPHDFCIFLWFLYYSRHGEDVQKPNTYLNLFYKTSKIPSVQCCFKTSGCQSQAKYLAKTFETLIKTNYMFLCASEHHHPAFLAICFRTWCQNVFIFFPLSNSYLMISECSYSWFVGYHIKVVTCCGPRKWLLFGWTMQPSRESLLFKSALYHQFTILLNGSKMMGPISHKLQSN